MIQVAKNDAEGIKKDPWFECVTNKILPETNVPLTRCSQKLTDNEEEVFNITVL